MTIMGGNAVRPEGDVGSDDSGHQPLNPKESWAYFLYIHGFWLKVMDIITVVDWIAHK